MRHRSDEPAVARRTSRFALLLLIVLLALVCVLSAVFLRQGYLDAISNAEARSSAAAKGVAAHARWLVESGSQALARIAEAARDGALELDRSDLASLDEVLPDLPTEFHVRVFNASGLEVYTNRVEEGQFSAADREYFRAAKSGEDRYYNPMLTDVLTGQRAFLVVQRLESEERFAGVAVSLIPTSVLSGFWQTLELGRMSTVSMFRDDGALLSRQPEPETTLNLRDHPLFARLLRDAPSGTYHSEGSPADGEARIVSYQRVPGLPMVAVAGISREAALERYRLRLTRILMLMIPMLLAVIGLAVWVERLIRADEDARHALQKSLARNRMLLREVHHRVKNNLQIIASLVRLQAMPDDAKQDLRRRIVTMAGVHEQLHRRDHEGGLDLAEYLRVLITEVNESFGGRVKLVLELDHFELDPGVAGTLGLIVNELITNTNKYAFPGTEAGTFAARLEREGEGARLEITNDGVPFLMDPAREGTGIRLIRNLAQSIDATYTLDGSQGLRFVIGLSAYVPPEPDLTD